MEQFGAVVGGPIKKDKLFFFAGYEGLRSIVGTSIATTTPETASQAISGNPLGDPQNSMVDAILALQAASVPVSPVSLQLLGCPSGVLTTASTCTGGLIQGAHPNTTAYVSAIPNSNVSDNGTAKIDYRINDKNMINGMFFKGNYTGDGQDFPMVNTRWSYSNLQVGWQLSGGWIYTATSSLVNEFRLSYNRFAQTINPDDTNLFANGKNYPINTGILSYGGLPFVQIHGFGFNLGGVDGRPEGRGPSPYLEFQDSVSYLRGKHAFKFGVDIHHIEADTFSRDTRGRVDFLGGQVSQISNSTQLEDFFAGLPTFGSQLIGTPNIQVTWHSLGGFFQDDWRITPKIMLNLGMRYAYFSPFREVHNHLGGFDPALGMVQQGQPSVGDTLWKPDR